MLILLLPLVLVLFILLIAICPIACIVNGGEFRVVVVVTADDVCSLFDVVEFVFVAAPEFVVVDNVVGDVVDNGGVIVSGNLTQLPLPVIPVVSSESSPVCRCNHAFFK